MITVSIKVLNLIKVKKLRNMKKRKIVNRVKIKTYHIGLLKHQGPGVTATSALLDLLPICSVRRRIDNAITRWNISLCDLERLGRSEGPLYPPIHSLTLSLVIALGVFPHMYVYMYVQMYGHMQYWYLSWCVYLSQSVCIHISHSVEVYIASAHSP